MKRISVFLLILVLVPCLVVPVSATTEDVVDLLTNPSGGSYITAIYNVMSDIRADIEDIMTPILEDMQARIRSIQGKLSGVFDGESLSVGSLLALCAEYMRTTVDYLGWIDQEVSSMETSVFNILQEIYTKGTLTIGECVKGIRSYIVSIAGYLETGVESTLGQLVASIQGFVADISSRIGGIQSALNNILRGDISQSGEIADDVPPLETQIDEYEDVLATAPSIDQGGFESASGDVNGKFNGITTDENGVALFGSFGTLANTAPISVIIPTSAMLAVLSFALFGRTF